MTSNAGVRKISNENRLGFSSDNSEIMNYSQIKANALSELKNIMSPELLNRVDDIIVFESLGKKEIGSIMESQISELSERLKEKNISIRLTSSARDYLIQNGYEPSMGARPMRRLIQKEIEDEIANLIICGKCENGSSLVISLKNGKIDVCVNKKRKANFATIEEIESFDEEQLQDDEKIHEIEDSLEISTKLFRKKL